MAIEKYFPFNSVAGDRKYNAEDWAAYFALFLGNGVFYSSADKLKVVDNEGMKVTVKEGAGFIGGRMYILDTDKHITLDNADGVLKRIDRIVLRCDYINRKISTEVIKGEYGEKPTAPNLTRTADIYELALADVYVDAGMIEISAANITDQRLNTELCGIVTGLVEQADTTEIFNQFQEYIQEFEETTQAEFLKWIEEIQNIFSEDAAGKLYTKIVSTEANLEREIAVERERINQISKMEEGSTTGDAELMDIRVGINGKVYQNAGAAVRVQVGNLAERLRDNEITEKVLTTIGDSITLEPENVAGAVTIKLGVNSSMTVFQTETANNTTYNTDSTHSLTETIIMTEKTIFSSNGGDCSVMYYEYLNVGDLTENLATAIIQTASGESITVNDSANRQIKSLRVFGKTTQDGTPKPETPILFNDAGNGGNIYINITDGTDSNIQSLLINTPNGLPGVKAESGGNYTDSNGQQWICDVIDFERGKYVQNVKIANAKELTWGYSSTGFFYVSLTKCNLALCTHYLNIGVMTDTEALDKADKTMSTFKNLDGVRVKDSRYNNITDFKASLGDTKILYALPNPIERDLAEVEKVDYTEAHTNYPNTTITNDAGAGMEVKYVADSKLYIDNKFAELQNAILSMGANI